MNWVKLQNYNHSIISRGAIFRTKANYPYEGSVDFMLIETDTESGFSILVTTGQKSGIILVNLPKECLDPTGKYAAISKDWIIDNWNTWIYESNVSEVMFSEHYLST